MHIYKEASVSLGDIQVLSHSELALRDPLTPLGGGRGKWLRGVSLLAGVKHDTGTVCFGFSVRIMLITH